MTDRIDDIPLDELGLAGAQFDLAEPLAWPESDVGAASGVGAALTLAALAAGAPTAPLAHPALARAGLTAAYALDDRRLIELASDEPIVVRATTRAAADALLRSPEHPQVAYLDLARCGPVRVSTSRRTLLLVPGEQVLELREVRAAAAPITAPLAKWLAACSDAWVASQVQPLANAGDDWSVGVAAGLFARLVEPAALSAERRAALLAGHVDPELAAPRQWARALSRAAATTLEQQAVDRAESLVPALARLEAGDRGDWVAICHSRDDLEGVALLLHEAGSGERLAPALERLDRAGRSARAGVPLAQVPRDERLRRAGLRDPDAWWGLAR